MVVMGADVVVRLFTGVRDVDMVGRGDEWKISNMIQVVDVHTESYATYYYRWNTSIDQHLEAAIKHSCFLTLIAFSSCRRDIRRR